MLEYFVRYRGLIPRSWLGGATDLVHTTGDFSWELWLRTRDSVADVLRKWQSTRPGYYFQIAAGLPKWSLPQVTGAIATGTVKINDGDWHHIVCVNARVLTGQILLYVDSALAASATITGAALTTTLQNTTDAALLGGAPFGDVDQLNGDIRDVRHYSRALTAPEVADRYQNDTLISDGLVNRWKFDDARDTTLHRMPDNAKDRVGGVTADHMLMSQMMLGRLTRIPAGDSLLLRLGLGADWHHSTASDRRAKLATALHSWAIHGVDVIALVGDITALPVATDAPGVAEAKAALEASIPPLRLILGNHDASSGTTAAAARTALGTAFMPGGIYWAEEFGGVVIIGLCGMDSTTGQLMTAAQLAWLETTLATYADKPVIVLTHLHYEYDSPGILYSAASDDEGAGGTAQTSDWEVHGANVGNTIAGLSMHWTLTLGDDFNTTWIRLYDAVGGNLLAEGSQAYDSGGVITLAEVDGSGVYGTVYCKAHWADDFDAGNLLTGLQVSGGSPFHLQSGEVRAILEAAGNVKAVLSGHTHGNSYTEVGGIKYINVAALVDSSYGVLDLYSSGETKLTGFELMRSHQRR